MDMKFSKFGRKMTGDAGILSLMDDLGKTTLESGRKMIMMGGGNPGHVDEFLEIVRKRLLGICEDRQSFREMVGAYSPPQGEEGFSRALADLLREEYGWEVGPENVCLTNGSQTAFFMLFNLFGGMQPDGSYKKICLPVAPEYIGYADLGLEDDLFVSTRPKIELLDGGFFKYHVDFDKLRIDEDIAAICVSRPTNPTGNVITDEELEKLAELAGRHGIPLIVDNAYGTPFPGMIYTDAHPVWNDNMIVCFSLSKLGLPAVRTGIVVAGKEVVRALTAMNAVMSLSPNNFGAVLARELISTREIISISRELMQPFYRKKMESGVAAVREYFSDIPCRMHIPEGAMFFWLWFEGLPISSLELYRRLKKSGVLVVSGHYFFPGLGDDWQHKHECLRVTYSQSDADVRAGLEIIAKVVREVYQQG
jgi:valine--pyruvate aminotransferase